MTKTKWHCSLKTMTKTESNFAVKINTVYMDKGRVKRELVSQLICVYRLSILFIDLSEC